MNANEITAKLRSYKPQSGYARWCAKAADEIDRLTAERDALRAANVELYGSLKHLAHNAKKSGADMGLALDFATEALAMKGQP